MLTKDDLKEFQKLLKPISDKIDDLEIKVEDKASDVSMSVFRLRAEFGNEIKSVKRTLKEIRETQNEIIGHFDKEFFGLRERIERVEKARAVTHQIKKK